MIDQLLRYALKLHIGIGSLPEKVSIEPLKPLREYDFQTEHARSISARSVLALSGRCFESDFRTPVRLKKYHLLADCNPEYTLWIFSTIFPETMHVWLKLIKDTERGN
jgi:hypothetical protein